MFLILSRCFLRVHAFVRGIAMVKVVMAREKHKEGVMRSGTAETEIKGDFFGSG